MERAEGAGGRSGVPRGGTDGKLGRRRGLWGASGGHWDVPGKVPVLQPVLCLQVCGTCCYQGAHGLQCRHFVAPVVPCCEPWTCSGQKD